MWFAFETGLIFTNVRVKHTWTNRSIGTLMQFVQVFLNQTLSNFLYQTINYMIIIIFDEKTSRIIIN